MIDTDSNLFSLNGRQKNRGIELNGFGELTDSLNILGGITFFDSELAHMQDHNNNGNEAIGVPKFQSNIGLDWSVPYISDLNLSTRLIHTAKAFGDQKNTVSVPDWTRLDLSARYKTKLNETPVLFQANLNNAFGKKYWEVNPSGFFILGMPRTLLLSMTAEF